MKKLTTSAFKTIRDRIIPQSRIKPDSLLLADWSSVLQMAHWLGFNIKTEQAKLSKELKANHCQDFEVCEIEHHRWVLEMCDRNLKVDTYLSNFEADLTYLKTALDSNKIPTANIIEKELAQKNN
ncbi:hypothetical protein [Chamaesiphon sp.]|uniref:hypothetical protein n=1 Tax=Chamaesiphon sp. TaxID=2814140 RepID=UPI0035934927